MPDHGNSNRLINKLLYISIICKNHVRDKIIITSKNINNTMWRHTEQRTYHHSSKGRPGESNSKFLSYLILCTFFINKAPDKHSNANPAFNNKLLCTQVKELKRINLVQIGGCKQNKQVIIQGNEKSKQGSSLKTYPNKAHCHKAHECHIIFPPHTVIQPLHHRSG